MNTKRIGSIDVICGPMFSGKSTELLRRIRRVLTTKKKCVLITPKKTERYGIDTLCTHDNSIITDKNINTVVVKESIEDLTFNESEFDTIFIDEAQFIDGVCEFVINNSRRGLNVVVSCLDMDFKTDPFTNVSYLLSIAHNVKKLHSLCYYCCNKASYSERLTESKEVFLVGTNAEYRACCKDCFDFDKFKNKE